MPFVFKGARSQWDHVSKIIYLIFSSFALKIRQEEFSSNLPYSTWFQSKWLIFKLKTRSRAMNLECVQLGWWWLDRSMKCSILHLSSQIYCQIGKKRVGTKSLFYRNKCYLNAFISLSSNILSQDINNLYQTKLIKLYLTLEEQSSVCNSAPWGVKFCFIFVKHR